MKIINFSGYGLSSAAVFLQILLIVGHAHTSPIYVYKEKGGVIRFSSKAPASGVKAEVFTPRSGNFTIIRHHRISPLTAQKFLTKHRDLIVSESKKQGLEPSLVVAVIHAESGFDEYARSPKGAMGLMQLMPETARDLGVYQPYEAKQNIKGGIKYLSYLFKKYTGSEKLALAAYNAGMANVEKYRGIPPFKETRDYVLKVLSLKGSYMHRFSLR